MSANVWNDEERKAWETLVPELAESEDERAQKRAIAILKQQRDYWSYDGPVNKFPPATKRKDLVSAIDVALSCLEKQQEQKPAEVDESTKRLNDNWMKRHFDDYKERTSAEWAELQSEFKNINEAFEDGKKEVLAHPEKYGLCECVPAEWSNEDSDNLERVDNYLWMLDNYVGDDCATPQGKADKIRENIQEVLSPWLKSLPERFVLQPKQEWSEEDEKMRNLAIDWAETMSGQFSFVDMDPTDFRKIITWLKSLPERFNLQPKQGYGHAEKDPGWISVKDRLPEIGHFVLTCVDDSGTPQSVGMAMLLNDGTWLDGDMEACVDYWMEVPKLKK